MKTKQSGLFADRKPNNSVPVLSVFSTVSSWPQSNVAFFKVQESLGNFRKHWPNSFDRLMSLVEWGRGGGRFFSGEAPISRGSCWKRDRYRASWHRTGSLWKCILWRGHLAWKSLFVLWGDEIRLRVPFMLGCQGWRGRDPLPQIAAPLLLLILGMGSPQLPCPLVGRAS